MNRSTKILMTLFAAASVTATSAPAEPAAGVVRYGDLDLSNPSDLKALHKRMDKAANSLCLNETGPSPAVTVDATCKADAVRAARSQVEWLLASRQPQPSEFQPTLRSGE
ncbi:MAG: UrcA family protein [Sphingomonas sp.]|nr:UrcA family protein [Sphingomonas sp.]